jgi:hypothetical protein
MIPNSKIQAGFQTAVWLDAIKIAEIWRYMKKEKLKKDVT